jgi:hypothetical protein
VLAPFKRTKLKGGSGACKYTVTVNGECFDATQVNFAMWGYMNRLCWSEFPYEPAPAPLGYKWSGDFARNLVFGWKFSQSGQTPFNSYVQEAVAFTDAAYYGDPAKIKGKGWISIINDQWN